MCACLLPALGQHLVAHGKLSFKKLDFSLKAGKLHPAKRLWKIASLQQKGHEKKKQVVVTPETLKLGKSLNTTHKSEITLYVLRRIQRMLNKVFTPFIVLTQNEEQLGRQISFWSDLHSDLSQDIKLM